jgi:hypothetical protein
MGEIIIEITSSALRPGANCVCWKTAIPSVEWIVALPSPLATRHITRRLYSPSSTPLRRGMLKITREELRIIVEGHVLNAASSMSINTASYEPRLTLTSSVTSLIFVSLISCQRAPLYTSCLPLVQEKSHER